MRADKLRMIDAVRPATPASVPTTGRAPARVIAPVAAQGQAADTFRMGSVAGGAKRLDPLPHAVAVRLHARTQACEPLAALACLTETTPSPNLNPLDRTGLVGQYVAALAELPGMPGKTAKAIVGIEHDLTDPTLSGSDRVVIVRQKTQATAKLLFVATSLPAAWAMTARMLPNWLSGARHAVGASQCHRVLGGMMNVARPVGDGVLFFGDAMYLQDRMGDAAATTGQVARASIDVGLDAVRLVSYALPQTAHVRFVAGAALFARTGLGLYDMFHHR